MDTRRILVAVNSLSRRDAAFERALVLARFAGAELYVLHAVPADERFSFGAARRLQRMADLRKRAEDAGVVAETVEQQGDPADIIEFHADARDVDLIVMGGEPRRRWGRRSPVAERVIRRTKVPTLVVRSDVPDSGMPFRNVLAAVDLSPASAGVLRAAQALLADPAATLTVMHAVNAVEAADAVQSPARWLVPEYRAHVLEDARGAVQALVSAVAAGRGTRLLLSTGSAARAILEHAADVDADLVVVGRSGGFKGLGATALRVLRKNNRALLVIPGNAPRTRRVEGQLAA